MKSSRITTDPRTLRHVAVAAKRHWRDLTKFAAFMLVLGLLQIPAPLVTMRVIDGVNTRRISLFSIAVMCLSLVILYVLSAGMRCVQRLSVEGFRSRVTLSLQKDLLLHCLRLPWRDHIRYPHAYLMARINEDASQLQSILVDSFLNIVADSFSVLVGFIFLLKVNLPMASFCIMLLPGLAWLFHTLRVRFRGAFGELQEYYAQTQSVLGDTLANVISIKMLALERNSVRHYVARGCSIIRQRLSLTRRRLRHELAVGLLTGSAPIVVLWWGAIAIIHGHLTVGQVIAFNGFLAYLYRPTESIVISILSVQQSLCSLDRVFELMNRSTERYIRGVPFREDVTSSYAAGNRDRAPLLRFQDVQFAYTSEGPTILRDVSLVFERSFVYVVVGPSGMGKSTLVNMIPRLIEPISGAVYLDGNDVQQCELSTLRRRVGLVSQEMRLFATSVMENIRVGDPLATPARLVEAARIAGVEEFVESLPGGYETPLGEMGQNISSGQRQRILLARAVVRDPDILILDESTGLLDSKNEEIVLKNLKGWLSDRCLIIISHRKSIRSVADVVIEVNGGKATMVASPVMAIRP